MNLKPQVMSICCLCGLFSLAASAHPIRGTVIVSVEDQVKSKSSARYAVAENVKLLITLNGKPQESESRTVKWTAYGRDRQTGAISVLKTGEAKVDFSSSRTQKIESETISTSSTRTHSVPQTVGRGRGRRASYRRVEGSGVEYIGYGVQVFEGDKVVGEKFEPDTLEKKLEKNSFSLN